MSERDRSIYAGIILSLSLTLVGVVTFHYGGKDSEMVSYVSFASSVSSIILSVVAIIYTFLQTTASVTQTQKLNETSERISLAVTSLERSERQLGETVNSVHAIGQSVTLRMEQMGQEVGQLRGDFRQFAEQRNALQTSPPTSATPAFDGHEYLKQMITYSVKATSNHGIMLLLLAALQRVKPLQRQLPSLLAELHIRGVVPPTYDYAVGFYTGFASSALLLVNWKAAIFEVDFLFPEQLISAINDEVSRRLKEDPNPDVFLRPCYDALQVLYGSNMS